MMSKSFGCALRWAAIGLDKGLALLKKPLALGAAAEKDCFT